MNFKLLASFPDEFQPNEAQKHILSELDNALESKKKFIIIQAPTASGKSLIAKTLANYCSEAPKEYIEALGNNPHSARFEEFAKYCKPFGTAVLTCTKTLQDQYVNLFKDGSVLKGKINYTCAIDENLSCEHGYCNVSPRQKKLCMRDWICPAQIALIKTLKNKCQFYNYSMYSCLPWTVKKKEFLVCDEASELEDQIVSNYSFEIYYSLLGKYIDSYPAPPLEDEKNYRLKVYMWLSDISKLAFQKQMDLKSTISNRPKKKITQAEQKKLSYYKQLIEGLDRVTENWDNTEYFIIKNQDSMVLKPYQVDKLAKLMFNTANTVVLMSATIVDHQEFARTLGIDDYYYIEAECLMDPKKAPIVASKKYRISYRNKREVLPKIADMTIKIAEKFSDKKGIVHTHSMEFLNFLKHRIGGFHDRYLYRERGVSNEDILKTHNTSSCPTVIVSPSMTHGVDLKGEMGEWQVIMKAPYPSLQDVRVARKFREDPQWFTNRMLSTLIQASGRCNRSVDDFAVTYILDANATDAIIKNSDKLPKYFIQRII